MARWQSETSSTFLLLLQRATLSGVILLCLMCYLQLVLQAVFTLLLFHRTCARVQS